MMEGSVKGCPDGNPLAMLLSEGQKSDHTRMEAMAKAEGEAE
jgi:hypothetical protein